MLLRSRAVAPTGRHLATSGKLGGTGLGTYSARLLTEAQNGSIQLAVSDVDNTTVITVHLPKG